MAKQQEPIIIRTLGDLVEHGYGLNALCERCRHRVDLDMDMLIRRFGTDFVYVGKKLDSYLRCLRCGEEGASVQLHNAHNPWKPKHDPHYRSSSPAEIVRRSR